MGTGVWSVYLRDFLEPLGAPGHPTKPPELLVSPFIQPTLCSCKTEGQERAFCVLSVLGEALKGVSDKKNLLQQKMDKTLISQKCSQQNFLKVGVVSLLLLSSTLLYWSFFPVSVFSPGKGEETSCIDLMCCQPLTF